MVAAGDANRAGPDKGVKLRGFAGELGCGLAGGAVTQRVCLRRKRQGTRIGAPVQVGGRDQDLLPGVDGCLDRQVKPVVDPQVTHRERGVERAPFEAQPGDGGGLAVYGDVETGDRGRLERTARVDEVPAVDGPAGRFGVDFDQLQQGGGTGHAWPCPPTSQREEPDGATVIIKILEIINIISIKLMMGPRWASAVNGVVYAVAAWMPSSFSSRK